MLLFTKPSAPAAGGGGDLDTGTVGESAHFNGSDELLDGGTYTSESTWAFSAWVRRCETGRAQNIFGTEVKFDASDKLVVNGLTSTPVFKDTTGWYHIFCNSSGLWVNGDSISGTGTYSMSAISDSDISEATDEFNGYIAQATFLDGSGSTAVTACGEADSNGFWQPLTDATLAGLANSAGNDSFCFTTLIGDGDDASTNANDFTNTNMSHTDNGSDDTPSITHPIFDPLDRNKSLGTISEGNRKVAVTANDAAQAVDRVLPEDGTYWEVELTTASNNAMFGLWVNSTRACKGASTSSPHSESASCLIRCAANVIYNEGSSSAYTEPTFSNGDILQFAYKDGQFFFGHNGTWENSADPAAETGELITISSSSTKEITFVVGHSGGGSTSYELKMEEAEWTHSAPSGYSAWTSETKQTVPSSPDTGSFTGNGSTDGPIVHLGYAPSDSDTLTINSNTVTWGTDALRTCSGFRLITSSGSYNSTGSNSYSMVTTNADNRLLLAQFD